MRIAVVALGRSQAFGEKERIRTWELALAAAGHEVRVVRLLPDSKVRVPRASQLGRALAGSIVPEGLSWSPRRALKAITPFAPDAIIAITSRAHHPSIASASPCYVLDLVDVLSTSYRDRAETMTGWRSAAYLALAAAHRRFERDRRTTRTVLAGSSEARKLDATWLPLLSIPTSDAEAQDRPVDIVFFGNLSYPPNIAAVSQLGQMWPEILRRRPGTTARVAGARPSPEVRRLASLHGWELQADFGRLDDVLRGARIAAVPLLHASGIQTKVLDAANHGVCQLLSPAAARGLHPSAPFPVAPTGDTFVCELLRLLDDADARRAAVSSGHAYMERWHRAERWVDTIETLVGA